MPIYSFKLEMAWNMDEPNEVWAVFQRLEVIAKKSPMQLNSFTVLKDGKEFPRSLEEYERGKLERARLAKEVAERRVAAARYELSEALRHTENLQ